MRYYTPMSKPRILGGTAKGRTLEIPRSGTRPSPARLRESLFNILQFHDRGTFLDLYSGSGAVALEAASRGWTSTAVDKSKGAAHVNRLNSTQLGLRLSVHCDDALRFAKSRPRGFDIVFAAPPYPMDLHAIFTEIIQSEVAADGGIYILQYPKGFELKVKYKGKLLEYDERKYGSNCISIIDRPVAEEETSETTD